VVSPGGPMIEVDSDDAGFFSASGLDEGPVRFTVEVDGAAQTSEWLVL